METIMQKFVITAAGGNATAIGVIENGQTRSWYETEGTKLMEEFRDLNVEQVGFVVLSQNHFEMSGGELCGNGTRAAGLLFSMLHGSPSTYEFTTSGHDGAVRTEIEVGADGWPFVTGVFPNLKGEAKSITLKNGQPASLVDLGGIVHVIVYAPLPDDYKAAHKELTAELGLTKRDAVGIDWVTVDGSDVVEMHPVVWVRSIDTYFYETSCGSGSISTALATGINNVLQPSGEMITVAKRDGAMTIASKLEVVHGT
jgi:diaminopimelate epimerase